MTVKAIKIGFSLYGSCSLLGYRYNTFSLFIVEHLVDELNQDFLKRYFFIHYLHTNTQMNITCTGMLFIAKWEKVYSFELFISFNWANNSKNSVTTYQNHFNTSFIYKKKTTLWEISNRTTNQLTLYLIQLLESSFSLHG